MKKARGEARGISALEQAGKKKEIQWQSITVCIKNSEASKEVTAERLNDTASVEST